jgi:nicotinamide-nucleotide adenylyltransferase
VKTLKPYKFRRALFVGRFQPFHIGHLKAVKDIMRKTEELVIAIGSAQYSYELLNPFTGGERLTMIRLALNEAKVDPARYLIVPVPDINRPPMWVTWVALFVGHVDAVFSNEPVTVRVFKEKGYKVEPIPLYHPEIYSSSEIRRRMQADGNWKDCVPKSVAAYIDSINGVARLKDLSKTTISESSHFVNPYF